MSFWGKFVRCFCEVAASKVAGDAASTQRADAPTADAEPWRPYAGQLCGVLLRFVFVPSCVGPR